MKTSLIIHTIFFIYILMLTNNTMSMEQGIQITVHNKLPLKSGIEISAIISWENAERKSYGGSMMDISPEKSAQFIKKNNDGSIAKLTMQISGNTTFINFIIDKAVENIYITTHSKECDEILISNSTQKLITLYAIHKKQEQSNTKISNSQNLLNSFFSTINSL